MHKPASVFSLSAIQSAILQAVLLAALLVLLPAYAFSDSPSLQVYMQSFSVGDLHDKVETLQNASSDTTLSDAQTLYDAAIQFAFDNYAILGHDIDMSTIIGVSVSGLLEKKRTGKIDTLWKLFLDYPSHETKAEILVALGTLGKRNQAIINNINNYLMEINSQFKEGEPVDYMMVSACIAALMELGDSSSYPVLFEILQAGYPEVIVFEAFGAMELISGDLRQFLAGVIEKNPPEEKFIAFRAGINSQRLSVSERGLLAELALEQGLTAGEENASITAMRYSAVTALTNLRWTRANALAIRHYYMVLTDHLQDAIPKGRLIEAIACLGAVGNSDAALVLGLQLGLINARTENAGDYDADVTLAIVQALGNIGHNAAFDHLLYASALSYNEDIIAAARAAIDRLKW
ncbi:MAG: hypothetical protein LBU66_08165 [Treponema sp.]|jgi:HEAT repeat protein|nr:hypothetical protein [Treponema sp.]